MKKINESPDFFDLPNGHTLSYEDEDAYAFGYWKNKLYISDDGEKHSDMAPQYNLNMPKHGEFRNMLKYPGRLWLKSKTISFWKYPENNMKMKTVCDDISNFFWQKYKKNINIWSNFSVDIIKNKKTGKMYNKYINDVGGIPEGYDIEVIPINKYKSSLGRSPEELEIPHVMTPMDKFRKGIKVHAPGFGAEKRYTLPSKYADKVGKGYNLKDIPAFIHHQLQRTSDGIIKLKALIESPDTFKISTGKKLRPFDEDAYTFGYFEGILYLSDDAGTHSSLLYGDSSDDLESNRHDFEYPGRMWIKSKSISFWKYPKSNSELKGIVNDISNKYNESHDRRINIWDTFKMDIIVDSETGDIYSEYESDFGTIPDITHMEIIPVKDYKKDTSDYEISKQKRFDLPLSKLDYVGKGYKLDDIPAFVKHGIERTSDSVITLKSLIENTIAKVSKDINVKIDIDKTFHAGERQSRHETPISDMEITEIVKLALPEIANQLMFDEINMGAYVLIKHTNTNINIVGALHPGINNTIDFVVITVMRKKDFMPKTGTKVIGV